MRHDRGSVLSGGLDSPRPPLPFSPLANIPPFALFVAISIAVADGLAVMPKEPRCC